ncbi:hypothetical protein [Streptomyces kanasensis]|uniref:hypothetical protein n=1 Tax=Streptomyces kanasensis TaxID=936756 RepID=UPI00381F7098
MHVPSLPEDLDRPARVWARAVTLALLERACSRRREHDLDDEGVWCHTTGAGGWWRVTLLDADRAVICGQDPDGSHTHVGGEQIDFLAGGPDWLPWERLRDDAAGNLLGFVYWWDGGAWHRIAYPEELCEDGMIGTAAWAGTADEFLATALGECRDGMAPGQEAVFTETLSAFLARAEEGTVDSGTVTALLAATRPGGVSDEPLREALDLADRAGLTGRRPLGTAR